ncbi:YndJ family transporter [Opitutus sp. ER46]|uniref:YndJ family transporter n=1 Tax=Opitutus sp. ER46 TaxID=2161864 RepID=UPI0013049A20|nr:YndJ family transporter [Opitutus sp. ER46]
MKTGAKTVIGVVACGVFLAVARATPGSLAWSHGMLLAIVLVVIPLVLDLLVERRDSAKVARSLNWARQAQLPAGLCLLLACWFNPGWLGFLCAIPWAGVTAMLAGVGLARMLRDRFARPLDRLTGDVGLMYLALGALWVMAERAGLRPAGFEPAAVALAAINFHLIGFLVPFFGGMVAREMPDSLFAARGLVGVVLGVPTLAAGMTINAFGWTPVVEAAGGCGLALGGMTLGVLHVRYALDAVSVSGVARALIGIAGTALFFAMVVLAAYAARSYVVVFPWFEPPQMRAVQATLLALGYGLPSVAAWSVFQRTKPRK